MRKFLKNAVKIFLIFLLSLTSLFLSAPSRADCTEKACIDVYVKDGQIVIEGKKNGTTTTIKPTRSPKPKAISTPKPRATATGKSTYRPRSSKATAVRKSTQSLADKILQSLPTLQVAYQPAGAVLPKVPVVFYTDLPSFFNKTYRILGVPVGINVKPKSLWKFGDGFILITDKAGKPYPSTEITHSYWAPGIYPVEVATLWEGTYTIAGITRPINGTIRQLSVVDVKVVGANTKFVGK